MNFKSKYGYLGLEHVVVAAIVLGLGSLVLSVSNPDTMKVVQTQLNKLSWSGSSNNTTNTLNNTETGNPSETPAEAAQVFYDEYGYATVLNIVASDINSWSDFIWAAMSNNTGYIVVDYLDEKDKSVVIPKFYSNGLPVLEIGASAFSGMKIHSAAIPNGVVSIGPSAFSYSALVFMLIPDSVNWIGDSAFYSASKLKKVVFLGDVPSSLGDNIFSECGKLDPIDIVVPTAYLAHYKSHAAQFGLSPNVFYSE